MGSSSRACWVFLMFSLWGERLCFNENVCSKRICPRYLIQARIAWGVDVTLTINNVSTRYKMQIASKPCYNRRGRYRKSLLHRWTVSEVKIIHLTKDNSYRASMKPILTHHQGCDRILDNTYTFLRPGRRENPEKKGPAKRNRE